MPCDFPRVYTGLALTGSIDCPRASCDLGIKYLMLGCMHETHGCAPARKTWGAKGGCGPWEGRRNHPPAMQLSHAFSRFSVHSCDFWPSIA